jgi:hypothetical protein
MLTAPLLSMLVIPALWLLIMRRRLAHAEGVGLATPPAAA